jgi:hypothetical protein
MAGLLRWGPSHPHSGLTHLHSGLTHLHSELTYLHSGPTHLHSGLTHRTVGNPCHHYTTSILPEHDEAASRAQHVGA